jgi:hypothetical protein
MNIVISSSAAVMADPKVLVREIQAGNTVYLQDVGYTIAPSGTVQVVEDSREAEDMVSLRTERTGVDNTIFVSTRGYAQHAPRIKIAVEPPHTLNATSKTASMAINDYKVIGEYLPPHIVEQAKQFIERNRDTLLRYWNNEIDTAELIEQLK